MDCEKDAGIDPAVTEQALGKQLSQACDTPDRLDAILLLLSRICVHPPTRTRPCGSSGLCREGQECLVTTPGSSTNVIILITVRPDRLRFLVRYAALVPSSHQSERRQVQDPHSARRQPPEALRLP